MTKDLTKGEPAKLIFFFTIPLLAGNIFQQLYAFVDTLIVGRFLGVEALAAVGCTGALMFLVLGFIMGFSGGLTIYTGQRFGAGDAAGVRRSCAACVVLSVVIGLIMTTFSVAICRQLLIWMQTPPEIIDGAYSFISIIYLSIPIFVLLQTQSNLLRALGDSRTPTIVMAIGLTTNMILEPLVIGVLGWGIPGAALATVASQVIGTLLTFLHIRRKVPALHTHAADWRPDRHLYWEHLRLALPMGFQSSIIAIGSVVLQAALNTLGPTAVASYAAAQKIESIAMMPMMSFGIAIAAYAAQNYGAQKFRRIGEGVRKCSYMSLSFSIVVGIMLILFSPVLLRLFVGDAEGAADVISFGHEYLIVNGSMYWVLSMLFIFRSTLQGLGQSVVPTVAGVMELVMRTAAAFFLVGWVGYLGACLANPMAWVGSCVPLTIAFFWTWRGFKKRVDLETA
ncbi:MATE family efflux transporter [uncultured Selenomonas sp.]|uniref:MATE family efflux transporter n=1 Tax=uncultured Selenomonas sp. TaxID=159275 RepID=UPI0025DB27EC|nr:MATE family efflux transporter [uncultured Selenomonas sp.]